MSSDSSLLVRAEVSSSSNSYNLVTNQLAPDVIPISDGSKLEKLSSDSLGKEASFNESSFGTLFPEDDARDYPAISYTLTLSKVVKTLVSLTLLTPALITCIFFLASGLIWTTCIENER